MSRSPVSGLALILLAAGCSARPATRIDASTLAKGHRLVTAAVDAQGGMAAYRALGGVRLHMHATGPFFPRDADYVFDPARNRGAMTRTEHGHVIEWRYDGRAASEYVDGRCTSDRKRARFVSGMMSNLLFWLGTPWKFLDAGATVIAVDPKPLHSGAVPAPRFFVTYEEVGDTPDDWYLVWLDPSTSRIARITYLVSGYTRVLEMEGEWSDYTVVDGFAVATKRDHHPKRAFWHALAPKVVHTESAIETHVPLDDALFDATCR